MKVVYIAGKFRAGTAWEIEKNVRAAEGIGLQVASFGAVPLIPHANYRFFHGTYTEKFWLDATMELLTRADAIMLVPGWGESRGTHAEIEAARQSGKPVFADLRALGTWLSEGG